MKEFLNLVRVATKQGVEMLKDGKVILAPLIPAFSEAIDRCRPFVFHGGDMLIDETISKMEEKIQKSILFGKFLNEEIDAPFDVFSIERFKDPISITSNTEEDVQKYLVRSDKKTILSQPNVRISNNEFHTKCLLIVEISPKNYRTLTYGVTPEDNYEKVFLSNFEGKKVNHFLKRISKEASGIEEAKGFLQTDKKSRTHIIRKIVHIIPKKKRVDLSMESGRKIDWSHRWEVRGHWVTLLGGLGKDRAGNYCVHDYTWRVHHEKGPPELPLVKKTRSHKEITINEVD